MSMLPDKSASAHSLKFSASGAFSRSLRSLRTDNFRRWTFAPIILPAFLAAWASWFFLAKIPLYSITETARLEADRAAHPIESPITGRVINIQMALGQEVEEGDLLVELENDANKLQLAEARAQQENYRNCLSEEGQLILDARDVLFRYRARTEPVLRDCSL